MAGRVAVLELALEHVGDGLETAVRMIGRADRLTGRDVGRSHLVEEQERIEHVEPGGRERPVHEEAAALEGFDGVDDGNRGAEGGEGLGHVPSNATQPTIFQF